MSQPARVASAVLGAAGFLLLSLDDGRLIDYLQPIVDRWPAAMAFYTLGLVSLAGALLVPRLTVRSVAAAVPDVAADPQMACSPESASVAAR